MARKRHIRLKYGKISELAKACGVSSRTVNNALAWRSDNDTENRVREMAKELGYIKCF